MEAKQQANLMIAEFSLAVLASMGHEINMDKVTLIAKSTAVLSVDKIIETITHWCPVHILNYWMNVKKELESNAKDK
jgi:hypothetical protein